MPDTAPFTAREFQIEDTQFTVTPLTAMQGFAMLEDIRHELGESLDISGMRDTMESERGEPIAIANASIAFARTLLRMRPDFVEGIRRKLFAQIAFRNGNTNVPQTLLNFEDLAFRSAFVPYELIARSLAVNFMTGIPESVSSLLGEIRDLLPSPPGDQTPSSPLSSMPDSPPGSTAGTG